MSIRRLVALLGLASLGLGLVALYCDRSTSPHGERTYTKPNTAIGPRSDDGTRIRRAQMGASEAADPIAVDGIVSTLEGTPLEGASVRLLPRTAGDATVAGLPLLDYARVLATAASDTEGRFRLLCADGEPAGLAAEAVGYEPATAYVNIGSPASLVLHPGARRRLLTLDERGVPVTGVRIIAFRRGDDAPPGPSSITDEKGEATVTVSPNSTLRAFAPDFVTEDVDLADEADPVRVVLHEARRIAGRIVASDGEPIPDANVSLTGPLDSWLQSRAADRDGRFEFRGVESRGNFSVGWTLMATAEGRVAASADVVPGELAAELVLRRPGTVLGTVVRADGGDVSGAVLLPSCAVADDGRFELTGLPPGQHMLRARLPHSADPRFFMEGETLLMVPEGGVVDGLVVTLGAPRDTSWVLVRVLDESGTRVSKASVAAWCDTVDVTAGKNVSDATGEVLLAVAAPPLTELTLIASWPRPGGPSSFAQSSRSVRSSAGPSPSIVELRPRELPKVQLTIVDSEGAPVPFDRSFVRSDRTTFDQSGTAELAPAGTTTVSIEYPGFAEQRLRLRPPHPQFQRRAPRLFTASHVRGLLEPPPSDATAELTLRGDSVEDGEARFSQPIGENGEFEFHALPPGLGELRVRIERDYVYYQAFSLAVGQTIDVGTISTTQRLSIRGATTRLDGTPCGGVRVLLCDRGGVAQGVMCSREDGTFEFSVPTQPSSLVLRFHSASYATEQVGVRDQADDFHLIRLRQPGRVQLELTARRHEPWTVMVEAQGSPAWFPRLDAAAPVAAGDRQIRIYGDLPPGPVTFILTSSKQTRRCDVTVVAGSLTRCVVD